MPPPATLTIAAHAKLNLALAVGPAQPPKGYHPIASWFVAIELHDTLAVTRLGDTETSRYLIRWAADAPWPSPIDWPVDQDLAVRAHRILEHRAGRPLPVSLTLDKRIPVGGGLGGGSSDAAAMLMGINDLFALGIPREELARLSAALGSDTAFFIDDGDRPRPALVTGFGECVQRLPAMHGTDVLLLVPRFGCATGAVYQIFDRAPTASVNAARVHALIGGWRTSGRISAADLFNDLAGPAGEAEPRLGSVLASLRGALGPLTPVHVTGSGSAMFCMPDRESMARVAAVAAQAAPGIAVVRTRTI